jgi:hypothetical protein
VARHNTLLYKLWRVEPITIKATLLEVLFYKPERSTVVVIDIRETRISQRQTQEQSCQANGKALTTETHGASAVLFPGGAR